MKWVQSVRFCDEGIHNACKTYYRLCLECDGGGSRHGGASVAFLVYMDKVSVKSIVYHLIEGEMMWEKAFCEFAATATGGKMTDEGARARWLEMVEEAHRGERLLDHDEPNGGCIQVWVKTRKKVNFHETMEKERSYQVSSSVTKNAKEEDIEAAKARVMGSF